MNYLNISITTMPVSGDIQASYEVLKQQAWKDSVQVLFSAVNDRLKQLQQVNNELIASLHFTKQEVDILKKENEQLKQVIMSTYKNWKS